MVPELWQKTDVMRFMANFIREETVIGRLFPFSFSDFASVHPVFRPRPPLFGVVHCESGEAFSLAGKKIIIEGRGSSDKDQDIASV